MSSSLWDVPVNDRMTRVPEKIPPTPIPATALPAISVLEFGATAQINDPSSKTKTEARKAHLI